MNRPPTYRILVWIDPDVPDRHSYDCQHFNDEASRSAWPLTQAIREQQ